MAVVRELYTAVLTSFLMVRGLPGPGGGRVPLLPNTPPPEEMNT